MSDSNMSDSNISDSNMCDSNMCDSNNEPRFLSMSDSMSHPIMSDSIFRGRHITHELFRGRHIGHELFRIDSISDPNMCDSRESVARFPGVCSSIAKVIGCACVSCACVCCACVYFEFLCDAFFSCV